MKIVPSFGEVAREAVIVLGGAVLAAWAIGQVPQLRDWIKQQWGGATSPTNPWDPSA